MIWRINSSELSEAERGRELQLRMLDPNLKTLRKQAQRDLAAAIRARVEPAGYVETSKDLWVRANLACKTYVQIQKSTYGFACFLNIGRESPFEATVPSYKNNTAWRIGNFEDSVEKHNRIDQLYYYDLANDPDFTPYLMGLLEQRALPFLRRSHQGVGLLSRPPIA